MNNECPALAIAVFRSRVAPVLDWCSRVLIFQENSLEPQPDREICLERMNVQGRLKTLRDEHVGTIICGAASLELLAQAEQFEINILHGISGDIAEVFAAYKSGKLDAPRFRLPGCAGPKACGGRRGRRRHAENFPRTGNMPRPPGKGI